MTSPIKLTNRFIEGLKNYNLTLEEIQSGNWKYCGGDKGSHLNYFKISCPNENFPEKQAKCICGHDIEENCYITNETRKLVLGNCCIKRFVPKSSRTCADCGEPHQNKIVNRCNKCRIGICDKCNKKCNPKYRKCYNCAFE